jgi:hypothetical protein
MLLETRRFAPEDFKERGLIRIKSYFAEIKAKTGFQVMSFSAMHSAPIARTAGLAIENTALAKSRENTEPFRFMGEMTEAVLTRTDEAIGRRFPQSGYSRPVFSQGYLFSMGRETGIVPCSKLYPG